MRAMDKVLMKLSVLLKGKVLDSTSTWINLTNLKSLLLMKKTEKVDIVQAILDSTYNRKVAVYSEHSTPICLFKIY